MKRFLGMLCLCGLLLAWGLPCSVHAAEYEYTVSDGQATITGWDTSVSGVLTIPDTIDGYPVTAIGDYAFVQCLNLTGIILPESLEFIGDYAFWGCEKLEFVDFPETMTNIGEGAFAYCVSLKNVELPAGLSVISTYLFLNDEGLQSVTIPDSVTVIKNAALNSCINLTEVVIPQNVTTIENAAFACCYGLTKVVIPDSLTTIGDYAFSDCYSLKQVAAPEVFAFLDSLVGYDLSGLQGIVMPSALTTLGDSAFCYCTELWYIVFPGDAPIFGAQCFAGMTSYVFYHAGNATWTYDVLNAYGGTLTWRGIHCFFTYVSDNNATCTTDGTLTSKCELCDATDTIPDPGTKGHRYVDGVCSVCGHRENGLPGDVNQDGKVNMKDWNLLYNHITEQAPLTGEALAFADVTGDGKVNMKDWNRLYDHISEINPLW